jgi:TonB family protein
VEAPLKVGSPTDPSIKPPRALHTPEPRYSASARAQKIEGTVTISAIISADGHPYSVKVIKSLEPSLDANAIEAIKKWKFAPATKDERPIAVRLNVDMSYHLTY